MFFLVLFYITNIKLSYVVRNLAFYSLRAIQEAVPHLEAEIFEAHERLANASDRSERIVLLYLMTNTLF